MGFGRKSRKEAQKAQVDALNQQNAILKESQRIAKEYRDSYSTRNAGVIKMNEGANNYLGRFAKGEDVASLNPALAQTLTNSANQTMNTLKYATSKLGDTSGQGDAGYQNKLLNVTQRQLGKATAAMNMQGLENEVANQRGIALDTANMLNADQRAGFGMQSDISGMASNVFNSATQRRQIEIQRSNQMMGNLMGAISGGFSGMMSAWSGGLFGLGGSGGGGGNT